MIRTKVRGNRRQLIPYVLRRSLLVLMATVLSYASAYAEGDGSVRITVNADQVVSDVPNVQGFLHGFESVNYNEAQIDLNKTQALRPKYWRIGMTDKAGLNHLLVKKINPGTRLTLVLSDQLAVVKGSYQALRPWENWDEYQSTVQAVVNLYKQHNLKIDYWDIWSEPDTAAMWSGTCDQAMETFKRTYLAIRAADPNAKIVGPSVADLDNKGACGESFFTAFIKYITEQNLKFDAIAWHEFNHPERIPGQADAIRQYFRMHPSLGMPEVHINEYSGPLDAPVAGWAVGWLANLEAAKIDWATRACWESGCEAGLNGLFLEDSVTPTPLYWVHKFYADLPYPRLRTRSSDAHVALIAAKDDTKQQVTLLVGRFLGKELSEAAAKVEIDVERFPFAATSVKASMQRIPKHIRARRILNEPLAVESSDLPVQNNAVKLTLPEMQDGEAYWITLTRNP